MTPPRGYGRITANSRVSTHRIASSTVWQIRFRRDLPNRRPQDPQDTRTPAGGQRTRRTMDRLDATGAARPRHDLEPTPARRRSSPTSSTTRALTDATGPWVDDPELSNEAPARPGPVSSTTPSRQINPMRPPQQRKPKRSLTRRDGVWGIDTSRERDPDDLVDETGKTRRPAVGVALENCCRHGDA
ncbi:MAG: hypothetical protein ACI8TP_002850 [Acidimicrobiales bacterium]|jgi:hypothetical protein